MLVPLTYTGPNLKLAQRIESDLYNNINVYMGIRGSVKT